MSIDEGTYEKQLQLVQNLGWPKAATNRAITWCVGHGPVGVARSPEGRLEIFIAGAQLAARSLLVRENLEYQDWYRENGEPLPANRLLLPAAGHFVQVAAFICTELLRNGAITDPKHAFALTEPVIELAIQRLRIADRAILGLCGELLLLEALVRAADDARVPQCLTSWYGFRDTPRDVQLGWVGVEVKTTTRQASSHLMQGIHQLEPGHGVDGAEESAFYLASIGLEWVEPGDDSNTTNLPRLVDRISERVSVAMGDNAAPVVAQLLANIKEYGAAAEIGYDHTTMADSPVFTRRFQIRFVRCYDMADPGLHVFRSEDLDRKPYIDRDSLRFRLTLPDQVTGDVNPVVGLAQSARRILQLAW